MATGVDGGNGGTSVGVNMNNDSYQRSASTSSPSDHPLAKAVYERIRREKESQASQLVRRDGIEYEHQVTEDAPESRCQKVVDCFGYFFSSTQNHQNL
jgi:hypothetical protein